MDLPDASRPLLLASILVGAKKPSGGTRPIAMGEVFCKLAGLYCLSLVRLDIPAILEPIQFALSPGGSESAVHVLQAALELHPDWVVISADITNAFNCRKRSQILASLFNEPSLSPLYRLAHWSYGNPSSLLVMDHGRVLRSFGSLEGVKQGDVLASLLFALSMKDIYASSVADLDCHAVAIMDDSYFIGPPTATFTAFDRFIASLPPTGLSLNYSKSTALLPSGSRRYASLCTSRNISHSSFSIPALGSVLSRERKAVSSWLLEQTSSQHTRLFELLRHPLLPTQHAFSILRSCMVPRMNYWTRVAFPETLSRAVSAFDKMVLATATTILKLPPLSIEAKLQLTLPIRHGGFGLRSMALTSPAAWWSALAQAFRFINRLIPSPDILTDDVPFVKSQYRCHSFFNKYKVPLKGSPVPAVANLFWSIYDHKRAFAGIQRQIMAAIHKSQHLSLKSRFKSPSPDLARIISVSEKSTGLWLTTLPLHPALQIHNSHFSVASRIRLGLPPSDGIKLCSCGSSLVNNPLHFLDCRAFRPLTTARHDRLLHTLARIARSVGIAVVVEPRLGLDDGSRTDANFFLSSCSTHIDVSVVHPSASSFVKSASKPLGLLWVARNSRIDCIFNVPKRMDLASFPLFLSHMELLVLKHGNLFDSSMTKLGQTQSACSMGSPLLTSSFAL
jgi:hypothetical protein